MLTFPSVIHVAVASHQMSAVLGWAPQMNTFERVSSLGQMRHGHPPPQTEC